MQLGEMVNQDLELIEKLIYQMQTGPSRGDSFETFVLNLLSHHLRQTGKELLHTSPLRNGAFDAYTTGDIDDIPGPVLIEVTGRLNTQKISTMMARSIPRIASESDRAKLVFRTVLIISSDNLPAKVPVVWVSTFEQAIRSMKVLIWGLKDILRLAARYPEESRKIAENLFTLRIETVAANPPQDWKKDREVHIANLLEQYRNGQFSLFLGAGVSSSAGMPDWNKLLNALFVSYLADELDPHDDIATNSVAELVARFNAVDEPSALMGARYLRKGLTRNGKDMKDFVKAVRKSLYELRDNTRAIDSSLIRAIGTMCMPKRTGARVRSVITYNFDDLVERQLSARSLAYRCIYTQQETYDPDELPVYHVHGFIPQNEDDYEIQEGATLVFSEEGYHQIYADAYHWSNLVQLNGFREHSCLMIGLSMTDPNLRRLLDIAARNLDHPKHFSFMKRLTTERFCYDENKDLVIKDIKSAERFLERHHLLNEQLMRELGVTVIWYEDYSEIPQILEKIGAT